MMEQNRFAKEALCDFNLPIIFIENVEKFDGIFTTLYNRTI